MQDTIFIQIASYRDPELLKTLNDCILNAEFPDRLRFGICWQHAEEDKWDTLDQYKDDPRFRILDVNYKDSTGACWARNSIQQLYQGETYTFQLDSHHRFIRHWDTELINMLKGLQAKGHKKPLITSYISSYNPETDPNGRTQVPWLMNFDRFTPEGVIFFLPATIPGWQNLKEPIPSRFYSAHFAFTVGQFAVEVQHDPEFYFHGEEITIAVRAFTHGYDLFHPHKIIAWHEYTRKGRVKQWDDDSEWGKRNIRTHEKTRKLLGVDGQSFDSDEETYGKYGLGKERTIADWERYAGIRFSDRAVQEWTSRNKLAPNPPVEDYENSFYPLFKHIIDVHKGQFKEDDYTFCAVIMELEDGTSVYRNDLTGPEINHKVKADGEWVNISVEMQGSKPHKWIVWPHSASKGWCQKIETLL
jgi:hypothetical protein